MSGTSLTTKLQFSNGYPLHFEQFARLLDVVCRDERNRIPQSDLEESVGLARRKIENLCSIAQGLGLLQPITLRATAIGERVRGRDPFFDDLGTLWFLHYCVSSEPRYLVWNCLVNQLVVRSPRFTRASYVENCSSGLEGHSAYSQAYHVRTEVKTVLDAYIHQRFSRLAYLRVDGDGYALAYREPVPSLILAAAIARFRDRHRPGASAVSVADLRDAENSPGRVFQLGEDRLREGLEALRGQPGFSLESRADLDQVRLTDGTPDHVWMERYYASR